MEQANQGNNPNGSASVPEKRKRGRPRKYPRPVPRPGENTQVARDQNLSSGGNGRISPRFGGMNGNLPHQVEANENANDVVVGQVVHGVIEATFDAGYLLTVKVGNSGNSLRGVVFKPGHYVPVGADNDVAPDVQMIRRNEIPFPTENSNPRSRGRSEPHVNSQRNGNAHHVREQLAASKGQQAPAVAPQTTNLSGNFVPVVLQPANLSNGGPLANQASPVASQSAYQTAHKGKHALESHSLNGSSSTNQVSAVGKQMLPDQAGSFHQTSAKLPKDTEDKTMKSTGRPFEKLLTEVMKRVQAPSKSADTESENSESVDHTMEDEDSNVDQPLSIEPLQAVQPDHHYPASMSKPLESFGTGKMTELLQAVQEKMKENQTSQAPKTAPGS